MVASTPMLIFANSAIAAAVLVLPISVRRECYDIAGDDFGCRGSKSACRSDDLRAATRACEKSFLQCVAVVGSKPTYTLKARHTPALGSSCQQIVDDVQATGRCRISHARRWTQNRCRGSTPWVADREDFRHLSLGSGADNSTFDGDATMRDDPTLHRALRCEAPGITGELIDLPEWKPTMDRLRSECTAAVFAHHPLHLSLAPRPRSTAAVDLVILVHYSPARNRRCFATEQVRAMGLSTDFPRLVVTTHMDKDRAPLRLFEKCIVGDFCQLGREHDNEMSAFAVHTAFQWAFEVARRSGAERVLFLEDDVIVREPQLVQAHIAAAIARMEAADPAWLALFMCSRSAASATCSGSSRRAAPAQRGQRPHPVLARVRAVSYRPPRRRQRHLPDGVPRRLCNAAAGRGQGPRQLPSASRPLRGGLLGRHHPRPHPRGLHVRVAAAIRPSPRGEGLDRWGGRREAGAARRGPL